jgi:hypothetical protein
MLGDREARQIAAQAVEADLDDGNGVSKSICCK